MYLDISRCEVVLLWWWGVLGPQQFLDGWFISSDIHMNASSQGFPSRTLHCHEIDWLMLLSSVVSGFDVVADRCIYICDGIILNIAWSRTLWWRKVSVKRWAQQSLISLLLRAVRLSRLDSPKMLWAVIISKSDALNPKSALSSSVLLNVDMS